MSSMLSHALRAFDERLQLQKTVFAVVSVFKNKKFLLPYVKINKKEKNRGVSPQLSTDFWVLLLYFLYSCLYLVCRIWISLCHKACEIYMCRDLLFMCRDLLFNV